MEQETSIRSNYQFQFDQGSASNNNLVNQLPDLSYPVDYPYKQYLKKKYQIIKQQNQKTFKLIIGLFLTFFLLVLFQFLMNIIHQQMINYSNMSDNKIKTFTEQAEKMTHVAKTEIQQFKTEWKAFQEEKLRTNEQNIGQIKTLMNQLLILDEIITKESIHQGYQRLGIDSKIITENNLQTLIGFFKNKSISHFNRLYRASQHNFSTKSFHQLCDKKKNTLVVLHNQFDKIIGGFTPIEWDAQNHGKFQMDQNNQSFLFSLTLKKKFQLQTQKSKYAIKQNHDNGPIFSGSNRPADLFIADNSNIKETSFADFGAQYNNGEYKKDNEQTYKQFSGAYKFRIKQWQVFQVIFDDK